MAKAETEMDTKDIVYKSSLKARRIVESSLPWAFVSYVSSFSLSLSLSFYVSLSLSLSIYVSLSLSLSFFSCVLCAMRYVGAVYSMVEGFLGTRVALQMHYSSTIARTGASSYPLLTNPFVYPAGGEHALPTISPYPNTSSFLDVHYSCLLEQREILKTISVSEQLRK